MKNYLQNRAAWRIIRDIRCLDASALVLKELITLLGRDAASGCRLER